MCIVGIGLVSLTAGSLSFEFGDAMTLLCAVFFAAQIIAISRYSEHFNVLALTVYQFLFGGLMGLVVVHSPSRRRPGLHAGVRLQSVLPSCVFASGLCYLFQKWGSPTSLARQGSLLLSLESVFGVWPACCSTARWLRGAWPRAWVSFSPPF